MRRQARDVTWSCHHCGAGESPETLMAPTAARRATCAHRQADRRPARFGESRQMSRRRRTTGALRAHVLRRDLVGAKGATPISLALDWGATIAAWQALICYRQASTKDLAKPTMLSGSKTRLIVTMARSGFVRLSA